MTGVQTCALPIFATEQVDRVFTYRIPEAMEDRIGKRGFLQDANMARNSQNRLRVAVAKERGGRANMITKENSRTRGW